MRDPVEAYFAELRDVRASGGGVAETSYYGALATLLNEVGQTLKPKVRAVSQLRNMGAGAPDFGLYVKSQFAHANDADPLPGQLPGRGVVEVKGTSADAFEWSKWPDAGQVERYLERYGLVLVTNLRDFVLVGVDDHGRPKLLESCRLATNEAAFWAHAQQPRKFAEEAGEGLVEFLKRVMLHSAPLTDPKDVAWFLASYARTARLRLEQKAELPALAQLREQLEESLGLEFEGDKGDHFFRSTLVQTLFYGVFAAWVLWSEERSQGHFEWETAAWHLDVPMISALFHQFADPAKLGPLGITEVLDWTEEVLNRVDRTTFFERFRKDHAVQYFYEPFLEAFDPQLRKELGVWYTPDEVVRYMVARVDWALREELKIADGLADESVYVLDPCCGTGAYLVEVLRTIDRTLEAKGADALTRQDVKRAAMKRIIGFEIMPAPFVVAHLQMGLLLAELGVPLSHSAAEHERAAIYLTNALTGWNTEDPNAVGKPGKRVHPAQLLMEFEAERDAAAKVKREAPILVVIGNPPYNGFAGVGVDEERELSGAYRTTKRAPKPQGQGLNDLFTRFFRMAERRIVDTSRRGVVCLITNSAWLDGLSYTGMRERYLDEFSGIWIDNLHGDKYQTGKLTPLGEPDPSIFSTEKNREGIQVGTSVALLVRGESGGCPKIRYRDFWGVAKRKRLHDEAESWHEDQYDVVEPVLPLGLPYLPSVADEDYLDWPSLPQLFPLYYPGVQAKRDEVVVDIDRAALDARMGEYFNEQLGDDEIRQRYPRAMEATARFDPIQTRSYLIKRGLLPEMFVQYTYRPFDLRWVYWEPETRLLGEKSPRYFPQALQSNRALVSQQKPRRAWSRPLVTSSLACLDLLDRGASIFPRSIRTEGLLSSEDPNITEAASRYSEAVAIGVDELQQHVLAITHAPAFLRENSDALMHDWPHVPLAKRQETAAESVRLGRVVEVLLDVEQSPDFANIPTALGRLSSPRSVPLDPSRDLAVTARWGIAGKGGICMPSTGKPTERPYTDDELAAIADAADARALTRDAAVALLGETCFDVYLNDVAYWRCVPSNVWRYTIGGYQVIKKWLSYREKALLGRDLKPAEARYVTEMVRRISALVLMQPELDANYERVKADVWEWGK